MAVTRRILHLINNTIRQEALDLSGHLVLLDGNRVVDDWESQGDVNLTELHARRHQGAQESIGRSSLNHGRMDPGADEEWTLNLLRAIFDDHINSGTDFLHLLLSDDPSTQLRHLTESGVTTEALPDPQVDIAREMKAIAGSSSVAVSYTGLESLAAYVIADFGFAAVDRGFAVPHSQLSSGMTLLRFHLQGDDSPPVIASAFSVRHSYHFEGNVFATPPALSAGIEIMQIGTTKLFLDRSSSQDSVDGARLIFERNAGDTLWSLKQFTRADPQEGDIEFRAHALSDVPQRIDAMAEIMTFTTEPWRTDPFLQQRS